MITVLEVVVAMALTAIAARQLYEIWTYSDIFDNDEYDNTFDWIGFAVFAVLALIAWAFVFSHTLNGGA
jgi:hypothetical protein